MKVLIYTQDYFPPAGGVQKIVMELARGLAGWQRQHPAAEPFEVTVVTNTPAGTYRDNSEPFDLVRCPSFWTLARLLRTADVVHLAGPALLPMALALLLRKPVVVEHHGFHVACPNGLLFYEPTQTPCPGHFMAERYEKCVQCNSNVVGARKSWQWLLMTPVRRWLAGRCTINVTPTDWLATVLKLKDARTVYHGVSVNGDTVRTPTTPAVFAFQGRLVTTKGVGVLLRAANNLRDANREFRLRIIGDGPEEAALKSQAAGLDGQVQFLGPVSDERLADALEDVSAVVMPSLGGEVFGLVAAENMLRGKLPIVSDIGALREVVSDAGLVFKTGDAGALAACMRKVIENPSLSASLSQKTRKRASELFGLDTMIQRHVSLYREALHR